MEREKYSLLALLALLGDYMLVVRRASLYLETVAG